MLDGVMSLRRWSGKRHGQEAKDAQFPVFCLVLPADNDYILLSEYCLLLERLHSVSGGRNFVQQRHKFGGRSFHGTGCFFVAIRGYYAKSQIVTLLDVLG